MSGNSQTLSIITAIHNALPMNRLFWAMLLENTDVPFELIIVDNHSTDGSAEFFDELSRSKHGLGRVIVLHNAQNQSYPTSQNQGMRHASGEIFCFLNNDIWLPPKWHEPFQAALVQNCLLVVSPSGQEAQPTQAASDALKRRWRWVNFWSKIWKFLLFRPEVNRLWKSLQWMYGGLEPFISPTKISGADFMPGIKGDVVLFTRSLWQRVPEIWDERVQAADWHLYLTLATLHEVDPSIPLPRILLNAYAHHFGRYSARQKFEPIASAHEMLAIEDLWDEATVRRLWWGFSLPSS
jgi:hypothetical protein